MNESNVVITPSTQVATEGDNLTISITGLADADPSGGSFTQLGLQTLTDVRVIKYFSNGEVETEYFDYFYGSWDTVGGDIDGRYLSKVDLNFTIREDRFSEEDQSLNLIITPGGSNNGWWTPPENLSILVKDKVDEDNPFYPLSYSIVQFDSEVKEGGVFNFSFGGPSDYGYPYESVLVEVASGSATEGKDFEGYRQRINFETGGPANMTLTQQLSVRTYNDFELEGTEYFTIRTYLSEDEILASEEKVYIKESGLQYDLPIIRANEFSAIIDKNDEIGMEVGRLYSAAFGRYPDKEGFENATKAVKDEITNYNNLAEMFIDSDEFLSNTTTGSNDEFITDLYYNVLRRLPDISGLDYWTEQLDTMQLSTSDVLTSFANSNENINLFQTIVDDVNSMM